MINILLRSGKDPFTVVSPESTLERNLWGANAGNLLFSTASHKILSGPEVSITAATLSPVRLNADKINERYDFLVLPFANALRLDYEDRLLMYTEVIERLKIPVVVLSLGAQTNIDVDLESLRPIKRTVKRFMRAVLERSPRVAVRGEFTEAYLKRLGFSEVDVTGCPSMFLFGDRMHIRQSPAAIGTESRVAVNGAARVRPIRAVLARLTDRYENLIYVAQDRNEADLLLWGEPYEESTKSSPFPKHRTHPLYRSNRMRLFVDPWPWLSFLRSCDFSFGSRIHGNLIALLAGTPAYVLAHDSRTLELARYFEVPHQILKPNAKKVDPADLYEQADFSGTIGGHSERFRRMRDFIHSQGLGTIFDYPELEREWDRRMASTPFPPPLSPANALELEAIAARLSWLRHHQSRAAKSFEERVEALEQRER